MRAIDLRMVGPVEALGDALLSGWGWRTEEFRRWPRALLMQPLVGWKTWWFETDGEAAWMVDAERKGSVLYGKIGCDRL